MTSAAMLNNLEYKVLRTMFPAEPAYMDGSAYAHTSKLVAAFGNEAIRSLRGKTVVDFGCGDGAEAIELAMLGVRRVIGLDIRPAILEQARRAAEDRGVANICEFVTEVTEPADAVISLDGFEHYSDPEAMLAIMYRLLRPGGQVLASFGPTWYHPLGGHLFSVFPWAHLLFSEAALLRWRSHLRNDGATRFCEVEGGLNQMTISRFEGIVKASPFELEQLATVPIRKLRRIHTHFAREFTTATVRARLRKGSRRGRETTHP